MYAAVTEANLSVRYLDGCRGNIAGLETCLLWWSLCVAIYIFVARRKTIYGALLNQRATWMPWMDSEFFAKTKPYGLNFSVYYLGGYNSGAFTSNLGGKKKAFRAPPRGAPKPGKNKLKPPAPLHMSFFCRLCLCVHTAIKCRETKKTSASSC